MSNTRMLLAYEARRLWTSRASLAALAGVLALGLCAIALGVARTERGEALLALREQQLSEQQAHLRAHHAPDADLALVLYYLSLPTVREPSPWAAVSTGLGDVYPASQPVRMLGLVPQLHELELDNPLRQLTGSFDLAFVLAFLLPLLIIGLGHDVFSGDEDLGTAPLLRAQPAPVSRLILLRLGLRAAVVAALGLVLLGAAVVWTGSALDGRVVEAALITLGSVALWTLVVLGVASLRRSSAFTAMALVGVWLGSAVLVPALLNLALSIGFPVPGGVELTLTQRQEMNAGWDKPKHATMQPFFARRPEWASTRVPEDRFSWPWYYAMHEVGDASVEAALAAYREQLLRRNTWAERLALLLPPVNVQLLFNRLAGTDLGTQLAYRDSVIAYHEALKRHFYPHVFGGSRLAALDFAAIPRHHFRAPEPHLLPGLPGLGLALLALAALVPGACRRMDRAAS
jgi:ABC-2 type transport system permease protein